MIDSGAERDQARQKFAQLELIKDFFGCSG
jgi:hypothetical protein